MNAKQREDIVISLQKTSEAIIEARENISQARKDTGTAIILSIIAIGVSIALNVIAMYIRVAIL